MPYREVIRAKKLGGQFAGHSRQHAELVATSACEPFRDRLPPGQKYLDLYEYQIALGEELDRMHVQLIVIDNRHAEQRDIVRQLREKRGDRVQKLRSALLKLKSTAEGSYGPGASRAIFKEDPPRLPNDPTALYQLAKRVFDILTDPGFSLETGQPGVVIHPAVLAEGFAEPLQDLATALTELHDAESALARTQSEKDQHLEAQEIFNGKVARFYEALYDLAGLDRLSGRLRRSSHVRPETGEPGPGPAPAEDGEPAAPVAENHPSAASTEAGPEGTEEATT